VAFLVLARLFKTAAPRKCTSTNDR
jgi:hypothetical protein